jgi:hypothetical protein
MAFQVRRGDVQGVLRAAEDAAEQRPIRFEHGGRAYMRDDIHELLELHESMLENFAEHLEVTTSRHDER